MRKAKVVFDITEVKTEVTIIDSKGSSDKFDITDTKMGKSFIRLLKQIQKEVLSKDVLDAIDINKWQES